jgi:hypothetical protein
MYTKRLSRVAGFEPLALNLLVNIKLVRILSRVARWYILGFVLEGFGMENVGRFSGRLQNFKDIVHILWPFGNFVVIWYSFSSIWYIMPRQIWQP